MQPRRVLVVDDDDEFRHTLVDALCFEGRRVDSVRNGQEAVEWLAARADDDSWAILLDVMMPVMDGKEFLARRAGDAGLAAIPVVVLTAGGDCRELRQSYQFAQCLPKTASLSDILAARLLGLALSRPAYGHGPGAGWGAPAGPL